MSEPKQAFTTSLGLIRWIGWAQMKAGEDWIRERELSHSQAFALGFLAQHPGAIQRDIAELTRTSAASVSSLLQGLERRELVERRTEDGNDRSKRVYATPAGVTLIAGFDTAMAAVDETILAPLDQRRAGHPARPAHQDHRRGRPSPPRSLIGPRATQPHLEETSARRAGGSTGARTTLPRKGAQSLDGYGQPRINRGT